MKRILIAAAVAGIGGSALAQSNVTVYGRLNTTLEVQKNFVADGETQKVMQNNASRIGFKGTEDLGGGLKANFLLEHRFNSDNGAQTNPEVFWAGDSWVGLEGGFGAIRLGRITSAAYFATADYVSLHNHDTGTSSDAFYTYLSSNANTAAYTTPNFSGFVGEISISAPEGKGGEHKVLNLAGNYDNGPLHLGAGYERNDADKKDQQFAIRGLYELGAFTVGAYYQRSDIKSLGMGKRNALRLAGMYTMGASEFHANVGWAGKWSNLPNSRATQFTLGYNYNMSKRTKLYAFYTRVNNASNVAYLTIAGTGVDPSALALGIRHNF